MSFFLSTKRILKYGFIGFLRNGFVSFATMLIMAISLFAIAGLMFTGAAMDSVLNQLEEKVDINAYFVTDADESDVLKIRDAVKALPEVAEVTYISREDAIKRFKAKHKDDQTTLQALEVLDDNPLGASLAIRAKDPTEYQGIAKFLENKTAVEKGQKTIIEKVNFFENKKAIDKLTSVTKSVRQLGFILTIILVVTTIIIVFNTIRLAIYSSKDEIGVMQLVGATNWYVRGPFVVEGALYGAMSGLFVFVSLYPISLWLETESRNFFGIFNTMLYFESHFFILFAVLIGSGIVTGIISSYLAVRRYLGV